MLGSSRYDEIVTILRTSLQAEAVLLIVINGIRGSGSGCQQMEHIAPMMPDMLEAMAKEMREDNERHKKERG